MRQRLPLIFVLLTMPLGSLVAQFPFPMLPTHAPLRYNPAFAGSQRGDRVIVVPSTDWLGRPEFPIGNAYVSYERNLGALHGAVAVEANFTAHQNLTRWELAGIYSPKLSLGNRWTLAPGLRLRLRRDRLDRQREIQGVPLLDPVNNYYGEMEIGLLINSRNAHFGVSFDNLLERGLVLRDSGAFYQKSRRITAQGGYLLALDADNPTYFAVNGLFTYRRWDQRALLETWFRRRWLVVGAAVNSHWYFTAPQWMLMPSLGYKNDRFRLLATYAYKLNDAVGDIPDHALELSVVYCLRLGQENASSGAARQ